MDRIDADVRIDIIVVTETPETDTKSTIYRRLFYSEAVMNMQKRNKR